MEPQIDPGGPAEPAAAPQPSAQPTPVAPSLPEAASGPGSIVSQPSKEEAPGWSHGDISLPSTNDLAKFGIDQRLKDQFDRQDELSRRIGQIQAMEPADRAAFLKDQGLSQSDIDQVQQKLGTKLKQQQETYRQASEKAEATGEGEEKAADDLAPIASALVETGGIGLMAAEGIGAVPAAELTAKTVAAEFAKAYVVGQVSDIGSELTDSMVDKVLPNAGWKTHFAAKMLGGLIGGVGSAGALGYDVPWLTKARETPEVDAAVTDTQSTLTEPAGFKEAPDESKLPVGEKPMGNEEKPMSEENPEYAHGSLELKPKVHDTEADEIDPYGAAFMEGTEHPTISTEEAQKGIVLSPVGHPSGEFGDKPESLKINTKYFFDEIQAAAKGAEGGRGDLDPEFSKALSKAQFDVRPDGKIQVSGPPESIFAVKKFIHNWYDRPIESIETGSKVINPEIDEHALEKTNAASAVETARGMGEYLPYAGPGLKAAVKDNPEFAGYVEGETPPTGLDAKDVGHGIKMITPQQAEDNKDFSQETIKDIEKEHPNLKFSVDEKTGHLLAIGADSDLDKLADNFKNDEDWELGERIKEHGKEVAEQASDTVEQNAEEQEKQPLTSAAKIGAIKLVSAQERADRVLKRTLPENMSDEQEPMGASGKEGEQMNKAFQGTARGEGPAPENKKVEEGQIQPTSGGLTPQTARDQRILQQGALARELGIEENEDAINKLALNRRANTPLSDDEKSQLSDARTTSIDNITKLGQAQVKASAANDVHRTGLLGDLFTHEQAKLAHIDNALGVPPVSGSVTKDVANAAINSSKTLETIGAQQGTKAVRRAKVAQIMKWQQYADPANVATSAALFNPHLWAGKALTDLAWLPYNNFVKGLAHVASLHPQDAFTIWGAQAKGFIDAFGDAFRYGSRSYVTGERVAEKELGMLNEATPKGAGVYGEDYDTPQVNALRGVSSVFSYKQAATAKNVAGMTLNAGPRVILAEDQFAKTFAQRAAMRSSAIVRALQEADEKGIGFMDRATFAKVQAEKYMNDQPKWLTEQANNEAYQLTFTSQNQAANAVQRVLNTMKFPETKFSPEVHWGRMIGGLFIKTPFNIMKQGLINSPFSPLMRESAGWTGDFEAKRLAATKALVGTGLMALLFHHAEQMNLTGDGPLDPNQARFRKEMGIPDRSIGFGGHYRSYEGLGPISTIMGLVANAAENYHAATPTNKADYVSHVATSMARLADHGPIMHQIGYFQEALTAAARGDAKGMEDRLADVATAPIRPEIITAIARSLDPTLKDSQNGINRLAQDNPWTRAGVPLKRDHWGNPQYIPPAHEPDEVPPSPLAAALYQFNPLHTQTIEKPDPVDVERMRVGAWGEDWPKNFIGRPVGGGVANDPDNPKAAIPFHPTDKVEDARLRDRLSVLAGHELTIGGLNQHDRMEKVINSPQYKDKSVYWQRDKLDGVALQYLERGRVQLMRENPDLKQRVHETSRQQSQTYRRPAASSTAAIGAP